MANFNVEIGGVQNPFSAQGPVEDRSTSVLLGAASAVPQMLGSIGSAKAARQVAGAQQGLTQDLLDIADSVDQGSISSQQGRKEARALYNRYIDDHPSAREDLFKTFSEVMGEDALGGVIETGNEMQQAFQKNMDGAIADGFVLPNMSREEAEQATLVYIADKRARDTIATSNAQRQAELGIQSQEAALADRLARQESSHALSVLAATRTDQARTRVNQLIADVQGGQVDEKEAIRILQESLYEVEYFSSQVGREAGSDVINTMTMPIKNIYNDAMAWVNGDLDLELLNRGNEKNLALATSGWLANPVLRDLASGSRLFPNSDIIQYESLREVVGGYVNRLRAENGKVDLTSDDPDAIEATNAVLNDLLTPNIKLFARGQMDELTEQELHTSVINVLRSVKSYGQAADDIADMQPVVDWLANPEAFGLYAETVGGVANQVNREAYDLLRRTYQEEVYGLARTAWSEAIEGVVTQKVPGQIRAGEPLVSMDVEEVSRAEYIKPKFYGGEMFFEVDSSKIPRGPEGNSLRISLGQAVKKLNDDLTPVMNKLIRMSAHFGGSRDYKGAYDQNYEAWFATGSEGSGQ